MCVCGFMYFSLLVFGYSVLVYYSYIRIVYIYTMLLIQKYIKNIKNIHENV